jgi:photosystem II stability/assembly factor-like uncharacterized protein
MKKSLFFIILIGFIEITCQSNDAISSIPTLKSIDIHPIASSIRALDIHSSSEKFRNGAVREVWFAGSKGLFGYTNRDGRTWNIDSIKQDTVVPHFRGIANTKHFNFLLAIDRPAQIFSSNSSGDQWSLVYNEDTPGVFYDAIAFWDDKEGIVIGDPTGECMSVLISRTSGQSWEKLDCSIIGKAFEGEAAFAASNSNIAIYKDHAWFATGGAKARVFHTPNRGVDWEVFETPIIQGGQMTGIFSIDFWDEKNGIIVGGDWEDKEKNTGNKAITTDGGKTWELVADGEGPGYRSCVKYFPNGNGKQLIAVGIPGISISEDGGRHWKKISDESFYTVAFGAEGYETWLAGDRKIGRIVWE